MKVFREDTRSVSFLPGNRGTSVETTKKKKCIIKRVLHGFPLSSRLHNLHSRQVEILNRATAKNLLKLVPAYTIQSTFPQINKK